MKDRNIKANFGRPRNPRHATPGPLAVFLIFWHCTVEFIRNIPRLGSLIYFYRVTKEKNKRPRVVLFSDNLDEINGIAINSRLVMQELRAQGRDVYLMGIAYHTRNSGVVEENGTILLPQVFSMEQLGYKESELAVPSLREVCVWLKRKPVDLMELETPSSGAFLALVLCKLLGIKVVSHYRTDMFYYTKLLSDSNLAYVFVKAWIRVFMKISTPVIVPSEDFRMKMIEEVFLKENEVRIIDRGIDLEKYSPHFANGLWNNISKAEGPRFLFVGRVSREKELKFLIDCWRLYLEKNGKGELMIVGSGPFLEEMQQLIGADERVFYSGRQTGKNLASFYAEADYFVFPSGSDTFGNVVVEALASGTPAFVSDKGGPKDIVGQTAGTVLAYKNKAAWLEAFLEADRIHQSPVESKAWAEAAIKRSLNYTLENSAQAFWAFYEEVLNEK